MDSWFCIYDKLQGYVAVTVAQICSTFLIPVHPFPNGPFFLFFSWHLSILSKYFPSYIFQVRLNSMTPTIALGTE